MIQISKKKGFTLIELLVVISIISLLSSIVLASLTEVRTRANDTAIKSMMAQMKTQAEIFKSTHGSYRYPFTSGYADDSLGECNGTARPTGTVYNDDISDNFTYLVNEIYEISKKYGTRVKCSVGGSTVEDSWAFAAPLGNPESGTTGWCVDSSGNSKSINEDFENPGRLVGGRGVLAACP